MYNHQLANLNGLTSLNGMPSTRSQSIHVCFSTYRYVLDVMLCTRLLLLWNYGGVILQELLDKSSLWSWSWSGPGSSLPHRSLRLHLDEEPTRRLSGLVKVYSRYGSQHLKVWIWIFGPKNAYTNNCSKYFFSQYKCKKKLMANMRFFIAAYYFDPYFYPESKKFRHISI